MTISRKNRAVGKQGGGDGRRTCERQREEGRWDHPEEKGQLRLTVMKDEPISVAGKHLHPLAMLSGQFLQENPTCWLEGVDSQDRPWGHHPWILNPSHLPSQEMPGLLVPLCCCLPPGLSTPITLGACFFFKKLTARSALFAHLIWYVLGFLLAGFPKNPFSGSKTTVQETLDEVDVVSTMARLKWRRQATVHSRPFSRFFSITEASWF